MSKASLIVSLLTRLFRLLSVSLSLKKITTFFINFCLVLGVTVDSLNEPNNPIIVNGRKMFQSSPKLLDLIKMSMLFMMPKLAKLLHIEVTDEGTTFFTKLSVDIMNQKREEFATQKDGFSKATSFIEFMIIAEQEGKKMEAAEEENDQKKPTKCNQICFFKNISLTFYCI